MAWNARVAGCLLGSHRGFASATMLASCLVRQIGVSALTFTIADAMRRAKRSSPYVLITSAIWASEATAIQSAAVTPERVSIRISSGPSSRNPKPRSALSSCGDETPRSSKIPSSAPSEIDVGRSAKLPAINVNLESWANALADASAAGSLSTAMSLPLEDNAPKIALL